MSVNGSMAALRTGDEQRLANWKTGAALAGIGGIASFQKSLLARSRGQQAAATLVSAAIGYGAGVGANALANRIDHHTSLDATGARVALAGAGALGVLGTTLAMRGRPNLALDAARTASGVIGAGAVVGAALIGEQALAERMGEHLPGGTAAAHAAILGAAALGTAAVLLRKPRATAVTAEAEAAYLRSVGGEMGSSTLAASFDEARFAELTGLRSRMRTVSGFAADTRLPAATAGTSGGRFLREATPAAEIARVMDLDPAAVKEPVRIYGGMRHAATREELAQKIFDEALDLGAFDRSTIILYVPSGTGHVNPMPVAAMEYLTGGDVASIGMQYHNKPSVMSLHKIGAGTDLFDRVLRRFADHVATLPEASRPRLAAYGESLGAISKHRAFLQQGAAGVRARGLDTMVSVGTPRLSALRTQTVGAGGHQLDATGTFFEFDNLERLRALAPAQRERLTGFLLSHYNDPVNRFSPTMFVQRPEWLGDARYATGIPRQMKWMPGVSGVHGVIDTVNGTKVRPGLLERTGHDYRADMAPVMAEIFGINPSKRQMSGITSALEQLELARVKVKPAAAAAVAAGS